MDSFGRFLPDWHGGIGQMNFAEFSRLDGSCNAISGRLGDCYTLGPELANDDVKTARSATAIVLSVMVLMKVS